MKPDLPPGFSKSDPASKNAQFVRAWWREHEKRKAMPKLDDGWDNPSPKQIRQRANELRGRRETQMKARREQ